MAVERRNPTSRVDWDVVIETPRLRYNSILRFAMISEVAQHPEEYCDGTPCPWHNPSNHNMVTWPKAIRLDDKCPLTERCCEHNTWHPDPDAIVYCNNTYGGSFGRWTTEHDCDGCCDNI